MADCGLKSDCMSVVISGIAKSQDSVRKILALPDHTRELRIDLQAAMLLWPKNLLFVN